jgi:putative glycosyltransferase (TIGR04372 family)
MEGMAQIRVLLHGLTAGKRLVTLLMLTAVSLPLRFSLAVPLRFELHFWPRFPQSARFTMLKFHLQTLTALRESGIQTAGLNSRLSNLLRREALGFELGERIVIASLQGGLSNDYSELLKLWSEPGVTEPLALSDLLRLRDYSLGILFRGGQFSSGFALSRLLSMVLDSRFSREPGLWNETTHFTAVGHLALFHYLLIAVELGRINPKRLRFRRLVRTGNGLYADWLSEKAAKLGVPVLEERAPDTDAEPNLELWPTEISYDIAWFRHAEVISDLVSKSRSSELVRCDKLHAGLEFLSSRGWDESKPTVGFHIQNSLPGRRSLRNSTPQKYYSSMARLLRDGFNVVVLSGISGSARRELPEGVIIFDKSVADDVVDSTNLAVWQLSTFFVGNLSGGTHPPGAFLTPTLWVDQFPISSFRAPGPRDLFIPKILFDLRAKRYLSLGDTLAPENSVLQTENPAILKLYNFQLREVTPEEIDAGVREMQLQSYELKDTLTKGQLSVSLELAKNGFLQGGQVSASFISKCSAWGESPQDRERQ